MKALAQNTLIQNRYLVVHLIGKGGMGEVYLAVDQRLGSAVALKRTYFAGDEMLGNAFEREARTLARMRHPVLPKVSDHFGEGDEQYLVMEHIAGDDLSKRLEAAQKPFPVSWVMFWADQLLDALSYLHSHEPPIIHRDIKPQNLKLTDENHIILLDFGLSKTSTGQTHISNTGSTGSVVGYTPHYAPMEQIRGIGTSARSDLYSLSATLYQLMTNVVPADALTRADAMLNGLADPIEPPHTLNPEVPSTVSEVILKGMEVSQEKRYTTAREMQKALRKAFTQMQEAMSAQTVAFNIGDVMPVEQSAPPPMGEKTHLMPSTPVLVADEPVAATPPAASDEEIEFDATLAFAPEENVERAQQVSMRADEIQPPSATNGDSAPLGAPPVLASAPENAENSFETVVVGAGAMKAEQQMPPAAVAAVPPKKKSGKAFAVLGGLAAILILGLGAAAAGWYYYNNYYAVTTPPASPSPAPSIEPSPIASVSPEQPVVESNTNTEPAVVQSTDTNSAPPASNTSNEPAPRSETDGPTTTRPNVKPPATNRPTTTAPKSTPKPKAGRATDILQ
jgi:serine/threonine protein kinase